MYQTDHQKNMCSYFVMTIRLRKFISVQGTVKTYLDHHDKLKRNNYLKRHKALGENWNEINAGSLSAFILWGESTDLKTNLYKYLNG